MAFVLTVSNQKGGVGKTTSVMNIAAGLQKTGNRVLVIDSDPQANLTSYLGVDGQQRSELRTLEELYLSKSKAFDLNPLTLKTSSGIDLIPCDSNLSGVDYYLFNRNDRESILKTALGSIQASYDWILIDTPPHLGLTTLNAFVASQGIIIPVQAEFFSLEGIVKIKTCLESLNSRHLSPGTLFGVLVTQLPVRRRLSTEVVEALQRSFPETLFKTMIRESAALAESTGQGLSIFDYAPKSSGASDYGRLCNEMAQRVMTHPIPNSPLKGLHENSTLV